MLSEYEANLYYLHDDQNRYYGWIKPPTRRSPGKSGLVPRAKATEFYEGQHPSTAAKAQLEREYGVTFYVEPVYPSS